MMKQAQQMQKQMGEAQQKVDALIIDGESGGGMVCITLSGNGEMTKISISPSAVPDVEMLEDLIKAAYSDAFSKLEKQKGEIMGSVTSGMKLPF